MTSAALVVADPAPAAVPAEIASASDTAGELTFGRAAHFVARIERAVVRNPVVALALAFAAGYVRGKLRLRRD